IESAGKFLESMPLRRAGRPFCDVLPKKNGSRMGKAREIRGRPPLQRAQPMRPCADSARHQAKPSITSAWVARAGRQRSRVDDLALHPSYCAGGTTEAA